MNKIQTQRQREAGILVMDLCVVGTFQLKKKERANPPKKERERNKQFKHEDLSFKKQLNYGTRVIHSK